MCSAKRIIYLAAGVALGISQGAMAAEEDSAYQWGRWAVLSPAAGGAQPYAAANTPGAEFNSRPGDAGFQPEVANVETPVVEPPLTIGPPVVVPGTPGAPPPGDPRGAPLGSPVVVPSPGLSPPSGDPRGLLAPS